MVQVIPNENRRTRMTLNLMTLSRMIFGSAMYTGLCLASPGAETPTELPKPTSRTERVIEGWTVRIDDRWLQAPNDATGAQVIHSLESRLSDIKAVVAPQCVEKMQKVKIVVDMTHGKLIPMQYHPEAEWLTENGYATDLAHCVHIPKADELIAPRQINVQPWCVLHELAHAYHDQVLGFEDKRILDVFEKYKASGHGDATLLITGKHVRHYALTNEKEFFAEMTESYFGTNDFFPFNRAELMEAEPEIYQLMVTIWGPMQTGHAQAKSDDKPAAKP